MCDEDGTQAGKITLVDLTIRFFFGKNKVMQIALGKDPESEYKENLHLVAEVMSLLILTTST